MAILTPSKGFEGLAPVKPVKPPPIARGRPDVTPLVPPGDIGPQQREGFAAPQPMLPPLPPLPERYPGEKLRSETFRVLGGALGYGLGRVGEAIGEIARPIGEWLEQPTRQTYALTPEQTAEAYATGNLPPGAVWTDSGPAYPAPRLQPRGEELGQIVQHPLAQTIGVTVPAPVRGPGVILGSRGVIKLSPAKMRSDVSSELLRRVEAGEPIVEQLGRTAGQIGERIGKLSDDAVRRLYDTLFPKAAEAAPVAEKAAIIDELAWAKGALATHLLARETQAVTAPRLSSKNFREAIRILRAAKSDSEAQALLGGMREEAAARARGFEAARQRISRGEPAPEAAEVAKKVAPVAEKAAREPWQMTRADFEAYRLAQFQRDIKEGIRVPSARPPQYSRSQHAASVRKALSEGKSVPPEVLADYPDLAKAAEPVARAPLPEQLGLAGERVPTFRPEGARLEVQAEFPGGVPSVTMREGAAAQAQRQAAIARGQAELPLGEAKPPVAPPPTTGVPKASPELKKFLSEIDQDIVEARQRASLLRRAKVDDAEAMAQVRNLQEVRQATINLELPENLAVQYESALSRLDELQAQKEMLASISAEPAYPYRRLSELASRFPEGDVTAPAFRAAVKKRFGQSLDEIAASVYPEEARGEELVLRDAQNIASALREARTIDSQIARARRFVKSVETGAILGIEAPKKIVKAIEKVVQEEPTITTLVGARRVGVQAKVAKAMDARLAEMQAAQAQARVAGKVPEVLKPGVEPAAKPLVTKPPTDIVPAYEPRPMSKTGKFLFNEAAKGRVISQIKKGTKFQYIDRVDMKVKTGTFLGPATNRLGEDVIKIREPNGKIFSADYENFLNSYGQPLLGQISDIRARLQSSLDVASAKSGLWADYASPKIAAEMRGKLEKLDVLERTLTTPESIAQKVTARRAAVVPPEVTARPLVTEAKPPAGLTQAEIDEWLRTRRPPGIEVPPPVELPAAVPPVEKPPVGIGGDVPPPQGPLRTLQDVWAEPPKRLPARERLSETWRSVKEAFTDRHVGLRQLAERTNRPQLIDRIVTQPGSGNIALERYRITLRDVLAEAGDIGLDDVNAYLHTRHALDVFAAHPQRVAVGIYKTAQEAQASLDALAVQLGPAGSARLVKAAEVAQRRYQAELQRLVQEGFLEDSLAKELTQKYPWYNPLRYPEILEEAAAAGKPFGGGGTKNATSVIRRLSEKGAEATPERPLDAMFDRLAYNESRIQRNGLNREIIQSALADPQVAAKVKKVSRIVPVAEVEGKAIFRPRKGVERGELAFWENGKLQVYEIPAWMYNEIARPISPSEGIAKIAAINNLSRAGFVTYNPVFAIANMLVDSLQAFVNRGVLLQQTLKSVGRWLKGAADDPVLQAYQLSGARQMRFYGKGAAEAVREAEASGGNIIHSPRTLKRAIVEAIPKLGEAGEQANRVAVFERQLNKYLPGWKAMNPEEVAATSQARKAAAEAVEVTINFGRGGWLVKQLDPLILFFNAGIQGTLLPYRFLRANPAARWRLGGLLGTSAALTAYNMGYPEYMDIPEWQRRGSALIMLPSEKYDVQGRKQPNYLVLIPNTRELAAFFGTQSFIMEKLFRDSPEGAGQFLATLAPLVTPLGMLPAPPILEEMFGQAANYDFFRSRPIVPQRLQDEPKEKQFDNYTSRTAVELGRVIGQSPMRISSIISGIFGGAGQVALSASDYILQTLFPGEGSSEVRLTLARVQALPPDKREAYLGTLNADVRREVERQARVPEVALPVVSAFQRRFAPGYGGEAFRTGIQNEDVRREGMKAALPKDILATLDKYGLEVPVAESSATLRGQLHRFTDEQLMRNQKSLVQRLKVLVPAVIASSSYVKASERQKTELLQRAISLAKEQARLDVLRESLQGRQVAPTIMPTVVPRVAPPSPATLPMPAPTVQGVKPPPIMRQPMLQAPVQP